MLELFIRRLLRIKVMLAFILDNLWTLQDCSIFGKDNCQESSYQYVSVGQKCVKMLEYWVCEQNQNGIAGKERKCTNVKKCEELPIQQNNHNMCKEGLDGCTIGEKGFGCQNLPFPQDYELENQPQFGTIS